MNPHDPRPGSAGAGRWSVVELFRPTQDSVRHPLKVWPYTWRSLGWFLAAFAIMTTVWTLAGLATVEWYVSTPLGHAETDLSLWLEDHRTEGFNRLAELASMPSDTFVKIGLVAALALAFPAVFKRWHDWAFVLGALSLEVSVYGLSSFLVGRPRPPVERLSHAPTESFPSGHMAAAVAFYIGVAIVVGWHRSGRLVRYVVWTVGGVVCLGVFFSRLYLGMHYVSDMVAGALLGALSLVVAANIARLGLDETKHELDDVLPGHTAELDLVERSSDQSRDAGRLRLGIMRSAGSSGNGHGHDEPHVSERCGPRSSTDSGAGEGSLTTEENPVSGAVRAEVRERPWLVWVTRAGWTTKALTYGAIGWAGLEMATLGSPAPDADYTGLVRALADDPRSLLALSCIAAGHFLYMVYRVLSAALVSSRNADLMVVWSYRVGYLVSAMTYGAVGVVAVLVALDEPDSIGGNPIETASVRLLASSSGRMLLVGLALAGVAVAGFFVRKAYSGRFLRQLDEPSMSARTQTMLRWTGSLGWLGRGLLIGFPAWFVLWASINADPDDVTGLDSSLHRVTDVAAGRILVLLTSALLVVYALFCLLSLPYRTLGEGPYDLHKQ